MSATPRQLYLISDPFLSPCTCSTCTHQQIFLYCRTKCGNITLRQLYRYCPGRPTYQRFPRRPCSRLQAFCMHTPSSVRGRSLWMRIMDSRWFPLPTRECLYIAPCFPLQIAPRILESREDFGPPSTVRVLLGHVDIWLPGYPASTPTEVKKPRHRSSLSYLYCPLCSFQLFPRCSSWFCFP